MRTICVIGRGAVGLFLAISWAKRFTVRLLCRDDDATCAEDTFRIVGSRPVTVQRDELSLITRKDLGKLPNDCIYIIAVKAYDLDETLKLILPHVGPDTPLVICSNGLSIFMQAFETVRKKAPLIGAFISFGALKMGPNEVRLSGAPAVSIAALPAQSALLAEIEILFRDLPAEVTVEKVIATGEWKKALINIVVNSLCTAHNGPNSIIYELPEVKKQATALLAEVRAVALADGFDLSEPCDQQFFKGLERFGSNINSTLVDVRQGRRSELDYFLGRFLRSAQQYDIATPVANSLLAKLKMQLGEQN